jgi:hypothetical protein
LATTHRCQGNDHISKISEDHGFADWQTVWAANSSLQSRRGTPNLLFKGDRLSQGDLVRIPDPAIGAGTGSTGSVLNFELIGNTVFLRLRILKDDFTAVTDADFELLVESGGVISTFTGKTDGSGQIEQEIPRNAQLGSLTVRVPAAQSEPASGGPPPGDNAQRGDVPTTWLLQIGRLNPIMERAPDRWCTSGVQQRLNNLCLNSGPVDGIRGPNTTAAVKAFQKLFGLAEDGKAGQGETQPKLQEVHDNPDSILGPVPPPSA